MAPDPSYLAEAAAAAGVDLPIASSPQAVLAATATQLRIALDSGAGADHASVTSLLALAGAASSALAGMPRPVSRFGDDAAAVVTSLGLESPPGGARGYFAHIGEQNLSSMRTSGQGAGNMQIKLRPAAAKAATEGVLGLVREDVGLGRNVARGQAIKNMKELSAPVASRRKKRLDVPPASAPRTSGAAHAGATMASAQGGGLPAVNFPPPGDLGSIEATAANTFMVQTSGTLGMPSAVQGYGASGKWQRGGSGKGAYAQRGDQYSMGQGPNFGRVPNGSATGVLASGDASQPAHYVAPGSVHHIPWNSDSGALQDSRAQQLPQAVGEATPPSMPAAQQQLYLQQHNVQLLQNQLIQQQFSHPYHPQEALQPLEDERHCQQRQEQQRRLPPQQQPQQLSHWQQKRQPQVRQRRQQKNSSPHQNQHLKQNQQQLLQLQMQQQLQNQQLLQQPHQSQHRQENPPQQGFKQQSGMHLQYLEQAANQVHQPDMSTPSPFAGEPFEVDPVVKAADEAAFAALHASDQFMAPLQYHYGSLPLSQKYSHAQIVRSVLAERERVMYGLSQQRQADIGPIPETMPEDVRRKAIIEGKQLRLVELQRIVRFKVTGEDRRILALPVDHAEAGSDPITRAVIPYHDLTRLFHRYEPPVYSYIDGYPRANCLDGTGDPPVRSRPTLTAECQRMAQFDYTRMMKQRAEKRRQFSQRLLHHRHNFTSFHGAAWALRNRVLKGVQRHFLDKKKAEEKRKKQEQVERLRLLRSNDEEAYLKLLKNTKNERLLQLVSQTDNYLTQIGAKVEQSRDVPLVSPREDTSNSDTVGYTVDDLRRRRNQYYSVTHSVVEDVRQPSIMVNGNLKPYQLEGLRWMVSLYNNNLNGILADEMGLGKTIQTISLITYLIEMKENPGPYLIIVPLSTLGNWVREFDKWAPSVVKVVYRGDGSTRRHIQMTEMAGPFNVVLTTYEFVVRDQSILGRMQWKYIIIDEGHRMKNAKSKMALTLGANYRSRNRLLLTGTPLQNNLTELWALLNFLLPNIFASADTFEQWFKKPFEQTTMGDAAELEEEETYLIINRLHQVLRPFLLRRLKTDVESQLPDKVETVIRCDMSIWQRVLYRQMQKRVSVATGEEASGGTRRFNNLLMQLKKICNHPFIFYDDAEIAKLPDEMLIRSSGKFVLLAHMLAKFRHAGHRTLIFSQMTTALDYLEDFLTQIGVQYMRLDGMTKSEERQDMLNDFNAADSPYFCFLLSTRAGGLGLNLQTADTVIIFDSDWNPMMDLQAQDRAHRIGQTKEVRVIRLISAGTVEVKILDQANRKLHVDAQVIQAGQFNNKATDTDRETMLKSLLRTQTDGSENMGDQCPDKEEVNRMIARSDDEFELYQQIDKERGAVDAIVTEESDLPGWVLQPEVDHKTPEERAKEEMETYGRGRRRRTAIRDPDQLTENEWVQVAEGQMTVEEAFERRERRTARRRVTLGPDTSESDQGNDNPSVNDAESQDGDLRDSDFSGSRHVIVNEGTRASKRGRMASKVSSHLRVANINKRQRAGPEGSSIGSNGGDYEDEVVHRRTKRRRVNGSTPAVGNVRSRAFRSASKRKSTLGVGGDAETGRVRHQDTNGVVFDDGGLDKLGVGCSRRRRSVAFEDEVDTVENVKDRESGHRCSLKFPRDDENASERVLDDASTDSRKGDVLVRMERRPPVGKLQNGKTAASGEEKGFRTDICDKDGGDRLPEAHASLRLRVRPPAPK